MNTHTHTKENLIQTINFFLLKYLKHGQLYDLGKICICFQNPDIKICKKENSKNKNTSTKLLFYYTLRTNAVRCENLATLPELF